MADIRIKDLATTASSTASDDFVAIDGSANGTRKLSAYSPTFGGNLTVSGTGTVVGDLITNDVKPNAGYSIDWGNGTTITRIVADGHLQLNSQNGVYEFTGTGLTTFKGSLSVGTASGAAGQNSITFPKISGGSYANAFYLYSGNTDQGFGFSLYDTTASAWRWTTTNSGNFLLGTTTDGGQKLQVSGTAYVSGDATFAGDVTVNKSTPLYGLAVSGSRKGYLYFDGTNTVLGTDTGSVVLSSNSGDIKINSGQALQLGNTYVSGAPTATGYVTIKDSNGTTYKVPVVAA